MSGARKPTSAIAGNTMERGGTQLSYFCFANVNFPAKLRSRFILVTRTMYFISKRAA
jgi:hypothetical protein